MVRALRGLIRAYQRWLSPLFGRRCRYHPTCSAYALTALELHGLGRGARLAAWRLLRCNPLTPGGVDYVPGSQRHREYQQLRAGRADTVSRHRYQRASTVGGRPGT